VHRILDLESVQTTYDAAPTREARERWLQWTVLNYGELGRLYQPPYGDRGVTLRATGELLGLCGYVPSLMPFALLPSYGALTAAPVARRMIPEVGLYWVIAPRYRRQGYAAEAGRALIDYAFAALNLRRIVATTEYDNLASQGVMRTIGMRLERNPFPDPPWMQVVGITENNAATHQV
jgi:RimJ/RimL family protein N-acetyltransferase